MLRHTESNVKTLEDDCSSWEKKKLDMKQMKTQWKALTWFIVAPTSAKEHKSESDYKEQNENGQ